ncbi:hypothetical protein EVAR_7913_1 [Eumeta japonica]|uniref:Uncharacterized protein n=1 Tax=Eumeta variegata TaxID=151549 RepID=A0A4C1TV92_EUMVA|nr:hypothetical protein EVAR_7913_1 [Eumeta japonica]
MQRSHHHHKHSVANFKGEDHDGHDPHDPPLLGSPLNQHLSVEYAEQYSDRGRRERGPGGTEALLRKSRNQL